MSLESNRKDFEKALADMRVTMELLDHCVDCELMGTLEAVVNEYDHYVSDIDELIGERDELQDKVDEAEI